MGLQGRGLRFSPALLLIRLVGPQRVPKNGVLLTIKDNDRMQLLYCCCSQDFPSSTHSINNKEMNHAPQNDSLLEPVLHLGCMFQTWRPQVEIQVLNPCFSAGSTQAQRLNPHSEPTLQARAPTVQPEVPNLGSGGKPVLKLSSNPCCWNVPLAGPLSGTQQTREVDGAWNFFHAGHQRILKALWLTR